MKEIGDDFYRELARRRISPGYAEARDPLSFGILPLDVASGIGGVGRGSIVEIYGPEGSGKTSLTYVMAAETVKRGGTVLGVYYEPFNADYARQLGLDIEDKRRFAVISAGTAAPEADEKNRQEFTVEVGLDIIRTALYRNYFDLIIWDSVAATATEAMFQGDIGDAHWAQLARAMSQNLPLLIGPLARSDTVVVFTNQLRATMDAYGPKDTTTGGRALKYYARMRIALRQVKWIPSADSPRGIRMRARFQKNMFAPPFRQCEFDFMFGAGVSPVSGLVDSAVAAGVLEQAGSYYRYRGDNIGQGREAAERYLQEHGLVDEIVGLINGAGE